MLRHMMHAHPALVVFRETHWLPKMIEFFGTQRVAPESLLSVVEKTTWDSGEDLLSVNLAYSKFETKEALLAALRSEFKRSGHLTIQEFSSVLVRVLFDWNGSWGDKTPDYGFYMGMIQSLWPDCRFVHVIRDGLATARSMARHRGCQLMVSAGFDNWCSLSFDRLFERYQTASMPLERYVASWRRRLNRIRNEAGRLRERSYLEIRYEDLLAAPQPELSGICSFLELAAPADWLNSCAGLIEHRGSPAHPDAELLRRLEAEDLLALNQHRSGHTCPILQLSPDLSRESLVALAEAAEDDLNGGREERAFDVALQMMTTINCHRDRSLLALAHQLAIRASRQRGDLQLHRRWLQSAGQHGFAFPDLETGK